MGKIARISGPVVIGKEMAGTKMYELVKVGKEELIGEVIKLVGSTAIVQVYEETSGLSPGEPIKNTGVPLSVELGPGLLKAIYDGIQRPLEVIGETIRRGVVASPLDTKKKWEFVANVKKGDTVEVGDIIGTVQETERIAHRILAQKSGKITDIGEGLFTIRDDVYAIDKESFGLSHFWSVRKPRPYAKKLDPTLPLLTGQRVVDMFFPIAKGGTACIPGPFGSGKTVLQHQFAKWSDTQVVVYVGCGERGNEMADVLSEFPELEDPTTGKPLMERTILIANTSNMPVAAREASIYTGITMAEYYRDMGYDVSLMADSTSRWAEAMREIGGRLEEMPGEEGYPAYLARKLAEFYERGGRVVTLGGSHRPESTRYGSVTIIGAVSPPGGDLSEPVSQNTLRVTKVFLALDASLAHRRHFPSIHWLTSYSLYENTLMEWYAKTISSDWGDLRKRALALLQQEAELQEVVQLVGPDALPEREQLTLHVARMIREDFLQQSAFGDAYTPLEGQYKILKSILDWYDRSRQDLERGESIKEILEKPERQKIATLKYEVSKNKA